MIKRLLIDLQVKSGDWKSALDDCRAVVTRAAKKAIEDIFLTTKRDAEGLQFISVQQSSEQNSLDGFWMLRDIGEI